MTKTVREGAETKQAAGLCGIDGASVPLLGVEVRAEVVGGHARARVRQRYRSSATRPIEAIYTFPLPTRAALTGFSMTVEGRRLDAEVREREEAFRLYDDAITAGHGGALLEQERANVFTTNVGNLLPGEETVLEIEYVEPLTAEEGAVSFRVPTVVAPRYMPGTQAGDRTGHGWAEPTTRVPDADRISPPIGAVSYGISLELVFDVGQEVEVESPSHRIVATQEGAKTRVTFAQSEVALDRDVVVTAYPKEPASDAAPVAAVVAHRSGEGPGTFALTLIPDLAGALEKQSARTNVVFVLDRSGSMEGASMHEARTALRLCLRQLREGDTFNVLAFDDVVEAFDERMVPFTAATLGRADAWIATVDARGGTELLAPLARAVELAPDGVVVVLTDGQVGNEDEIERVILGLRRSARIYSFGIGTNVSDALLVALADKSGGAVEKIHPGERVDEKVVAQFARATAPRVTDLKVAFRGVEVGEIAPAEPVALVDSEPFTVFGTYDSPGRGAIEIRGMLEKEAFYLEVPIDLPERADRPAVAKLWARARIGDLEHVVVSGRRADAMKDRIVRLAKEHGVASRYTSFVVVEKRTGDRRASGQPETRVVPVSPPAGWDMLKKADQAKPKSLRSKLAAFRMPAPLSRLMPAPPPMAPPPPAPRQEASDGARPLRAVAFEAASGASLDSDQEGSLGAAAPREELCEELCEEVREEVREEPRDPVVAILARQGASGLWEETGKTTLEATTAALAALLREEITAADPVYGAQIKKAVDALLAALETAPEAEPRVVELALGLAWLVSSGRRTRQRIDGLARRRPGLEALRAALASEAAVRARVEALTC